jgi:DNA uptake protein ComE-like DNA-binding protein
MLEPEMKVSGYFLLRALSHQRSANLCTAKDAKGRKEKHFWHPARTCSIIPEQLRPASRIPTIRRYDRDSACHSHTAADWRASGVAAQPEMGLSAERRLGADFADRFNFVFAGIRMRFLILSLIVCGVLVWGCNQQDTAKTRQQAQQATEKIKQESKVAAVELKKGAKEAAAQTKAAVQGVKDGLDSPDKPVNINSASKSELQTLPGIDEETANRIINGRPYHTRDEVGTKGVVSPEEFSAIKDKIVVK